jgi:hypothetical protein
MESGKSENSLQHSGVVPADPQFAGALIYDARKFRDSIADPLIAPKTSQIQYRKIQQEHPAR